MKAALIPRSERGICCPKCGCRHFFTTHTEPLCDGRIRRRKTCRHCGKRVITYEAPLGASPGSGDRTPLEPQAERCWLVDGVGQRQLAAVSRREKMN